MRITGEVRSVRVRLVASNEKEGSGSVRIQSWDSRQRSRRALKAFGMCWGAALISLMFPLVHFVLVPGFLLGGPVVAFFIYAQESELLDGECTCPSCGKPLQIARSRPSWPMNDVCSSCHEAIRIQLA